MSKNPKGESDLLTFLLGVLLACGLLAALLLPALPADAKWSGATVLYPLSDLTLLAQENMGWALLGCILLAAAGCLLCPSPERFRQKKAAGVKVAARRMALPALCGMLVLLAVLAVLCVPDLYRGLLLWAGGHRGLTVAAALVLVPGMYLLGSRAVPPVRDVEGSGKALSRGLRIFEGVLVALFCAAVVLPVWKGLRLYLLPLAVLLALLPGTLCEWRLAKRATGLRPMYLALRTLRGLGMVVFFPFTLLALGYALVSGKE